MKKTLMYAIVISALVVAAVVYFVTRSSTHSAISATGPNAFTGRIVQSTMAPGNYTNLTVLSDQGCTTDPKTGLSNCTTSFTTKSGTVYFNYEHDMMMKPCLSAGDKVNVQVFGDGSTIVERTYWNGGGA